MDNKIEILVIDDEKDFTQLMKEILERYNYNVTECNDAASALDHVNLEKFDVLFLDLIMPQVNGLEILQQVKMIDSTLPVVILTGDTRKSVVEQALRYGAYDFLHKPLDWDRLELVVKNAIRVRQLEKKLGHLEQYIDEKYNVQNLVAYSQQMQDVVKRLERVIPSEAAVMLHGEVGTGRELIARTVHFNSRRKEKPFVVFNCSALPDNVLDKEIFGSEYEAKSGEIKRLPGKFEQANGGTIYLNEVGDLSKNAQGKIFQVIKEGSIIPNGSTQPISLDIRIISSTVKNFEEEVENGRFRKDLYFFLNVFPISIPSLRERGEDIPVLVNSFIEDFNRKNNTAISSISKEVLDYLGSYDWPGNLNELQNVIERSMLMVDKDILKPEHLPISVVSQKDLEASGGMFMDMKKAVTLCNNVVPLDEIESAILKQALKLNNYNMSSTAHKLGIGRTTLYRKLEKYHIKLNR